MLINGQPAARIGDACVRIGPPDAITGGSSKVIIAGSPTVIIN